MDIILLYATNFWQEILFGVSLFTFITAVLLKMASFPEQQTEMTKSQWLELKRAGMV